METKNNNRTLQRNKVAEKPKDFKKSIARLFKSLGKFRILIISSLILASLSSLLSLVSPNLLKDLTDKISEGVIINTTNLNLLQEDILKNVKEDNFSNEVNNILDLKLDEKAINKIKTSSSVSIEDMEKFNSIINNPNNQNNNIYKEIPISIYYVLLEDTTYKDILITKEDKIKFLEVLNGIKKDSKDYSFVKEIPDSINTILFPSSKIKNKVITSQDKVAFILAFSQLNGESDVNTIYSKIDTLPANIVELIQPVMDFQFIKKLTIILITIYIISAVFRYIEGILMINVANKYANRLRDNISKKINQLPLKFFDNNSSGDILSRVTNDVDTIAQSLNNSLSEVVAAITMLLGSIIMMFITNSLMAITAIVSSVLGFIVMAFILDKSQKYFSARQRELGKLNGYIEEIYSGLNVIKTCNAKEATRNEFDKLNKKVYECNRKSQFLSGLMQPIMMFVGNLGYVSVCVIGAILVSKNIISFGIIVAFIMYVRLFISPLSSIAQSFASLQTTAASSERVFEFLDATEMPSEKDLKNKLTKNNVKGHIEFQDVKFGYDPNKIIIKDFNAIAMPGEKIAIVGPTGAGKTTIVNLLMKFYDINDGDIKIDGVSIKDLTRENIHKLFTMVLQDTWLFHGTVRENLVYNRKNISDKEMKKVCQIVGIDHFIKTLPKGYDTVINNDDSISAGQKQLLTIARAMLEDTPFLILDEATSNVDTRTEELVQKAMDKLIKNKTSFIIAHRLSTIKNADLILVMKDGNIIEKGNHIELMQQNGFYASLYNSQFEKVEQKKL